MNNKQMIMGVNYTKVIVIITLIVLTVLLMENAIKMSLIPRKIELRVMQLVGATNWFISCPIIIEGLITGFIGVVISAISLFGLYNIFYDTFSSDLNILKPQNIIIMILFLSIYGILISVFSSSMALRKTLKSLD